MPSIKVKICEVQDLRAVADLLYELKEVAGTDNDFIEEDLDALVIHAEICIHNQILMLNDFGNNNGFSKSGGYQLCVSFENEDDLQDAYSVMKNGSITIDAMQATDYSTCVVRFIDKFDVRWGLWCN